MESQGWRNGDPEPSVRPVRASRRPEKKKSDLPILMAEVVADASGSERTWDCSARGLCSCSREREIFEYLVIPQIYQVKITIMNLYKHTN